MTQDESQDVPLKSGQLGAMLISNDSVFFFSHSSVPEQPLFLSFSLLLNGKFRIHLELLGRLFVKDSDYQVILNEFVFECSKFAVSANR